ncbi:hypothetical protein AB4K20DRAFT_1926726 [Rhizopus microsporus]
MDLHYLMSMIWFTLLLIRLMRLLSRFWHHRLFILFLLQFEFLFVIRFMFDQISIVN